MSESNAVSSKYLLVQGITLARIPLAIAFSAVILNAPPQYESPSIPLLLACSALLAISEVSDFLDGFLARRLAVVSEWGAMLDPYSDSVSRLIVYWSLASAGLALSIVPLVMALRDVTVAYCRITWVRQGKSVSAKWSGKIKAVVQGVVAFVLLWNPAFADTVGKGVAPFSWLVIAVTVYSALDYLRPKK